VELEISAAVQQAMSADLVTYRHIQGQARFDHTGSMYCRGTRHSMRHLRFDIQMEDNCNGQNGRREDTDGNSQSGTRRRRENQDSRR